MEGARCLAASVRDKDGLIIGAIGISAPIARFPREHDAVFAQQVCEARGTSAPFSAPMDNSERGGSLSGSRWVNTSN